MQKEAEELLAKGVSEPYAGNAGFYSYLFVVLHLWVVYVQYVIFITSVATCTCLILKCLQ